MLTPHKNLDKTFVPSVGETQREKKILVGMIYRHFVQRARNLQKMMSSLSCFSFSLSNITNFWSFFMCDVKQIPTLLVFPFKKKKVQETSTYLLWKWYKTYSNILPYSPRHGSLHPILLLPAFLFLYVSPLLWLKWFCCPLKSDVLRSDRKMELARNKRHIHFNCLVVDPEASQLWPHGSLLPPVCLWRKHVRTCSENGPAECAE